jgi:hypothetical protein
VTEGYLGEIAELLMQAAVLAIESKYEKIDLTIIEKLNWKNPTQRRARAFGL